ncbi:TIGR00341 family protein [Thiomicrorhabdus sediminis]|uniref:TIGR00341 family protein n=1 Tax=Thiomicrorhabdus sediminis TaxID=2580412 RepID=A0A4P9K2T3_9GAMM|nr:TIGR00341 family protein [Thiomicrorhabdus sediminis]QCU89129.1 TIGR00341 family protein [Thiomicrorhabdus sediminis]
MSEFTVIYSRAEETEFKAQVEPAMAEISCDFLAFENDIKALPEGAKVIFWGSDDLLRIIIPQLQQAQCSIGFLPHPKLVRVSQNFYIPSAMDKALQNILDSADEHEKTDLMYFNDQLVQGSVKIGQVETMKASASAVEGFWSKLWYLLTLIFSLSHSRLCPYTLTTSNQTEIKTAALGMTVVYRLAGSTFTKDALGSRSYDESSLNVVVLAPRSILELVTFLLKRVFVQQSFDSSLPTYLGHIKSQSITIESSSGFACLVDGEESMHDKVTISVAENALRVMSANLPEKSTNEEQKESIRTQYLPRGQAVNELTNKSLPWIYHTDIEEVKETFVTLKDNSQASQSYWVLMVLSSLLATVGLFANSAPVIIGAMVLAPLMAPIISLSMGVLRQNAELSLASAKTLVLGILLALVFATLLTLVTPLHMINSEISARLTPTILDLAVAIIAGTAAAYAHSRSEVMRSLAGVAIAVALVPPLAVSGIGIGWMDWQVFSSAFLLFITNLFGITLAAAMTFLFMGFSPFVLARKGVLISLLVVSLVSIPLYVAFQKMVVKESIVAQLDGMSVGDIQIKDVQVRSENPLYISVKLLSQQPLNKMEIDSVKKAMEAKVGKSIVLEATEAVLLD